MKTVLTLGNINVNNFEALHAIIGYAGYSGSLKLVDEETYILDLSTPEFRASAGITETEVKVMVADLVMHTSVTVTAKHTFEEAE